METLCTEAWKVTTRSWQRTAWIDLPRASDPTPAPDDSDFAYYVHLHDRLLLFADYASLVHAAPALQAVDKLIPVPVVPPPKPVRRWYQFWK